MNFRVKKLLLVLFVLLLSAVLPCKQTNSPPFLFQSFPFSKSKPKPDTSRRLSEEDISPFTVP